MKRVIVAGATLLSLMSGVGAAYAEDNAHSGNKAPVVLAANDSVVLVKKSNAPDVAQQPEFEPPIISGGKVHQYLGIATMGAAAATFLTHPDNCEVAACVNQPRQLHNAHANFGRATAVLATATVISGLISHWDDFSTEDGITDPDNLHVLLGAGGAAMMAYAINRSMNSTTPVSHAALAELGALSMLMAIKLTW